MNVGETVEDFVLKDTSGNDLRLYDQISDGKVLILFFPLAFSSVCTDEMCHYRDNMKLYNSLNANILGISVDSFFTLKEFKRSNNLPFPLVSDFNKKVSRQFGVLNEDYFGMNGVAKRAAFVINSEGVVEYSEIVENSDLLPDFKAIQHALEE
ncbi:MAG: redoxin domain-containing protein [Balneolaceae bacterium]|nr:redoxin domain-containing protein [Balneolaceae bacterium]